jgi:phage/plasmid-like protein (TIGR03299 family)
MPANIDSMAYHETKPWHGLGVEVPVDVTSAGMIVAAGLNWIVEKRPARGASNKRSGVASRYEIVRMPRHSKESEVLLGVVTRRYEPLQNREAFDFFDPMIGEGKARYETAGALGDGERVWVLAKMPDAFEVIPGDNCMKYLLLSNSHNGQGAVTVKFTAIRVVCQNTLMLSLHDGQQALRVRHSKIMTERLAEVSAIIETATEVYATASELFRRMVEIAMNDHQFESYLRLVFPKSEHQEKRRTEPKRWTHIRRVLQTTPDLQTDGVKGTLWAAYNAVMRFEDYKNGRADETPDERLDRVWFGGGATIKLRALEKAKEMVKEAC